MRGSTRKNIIRPGGSGATPSAEFHSTLSTSPLFPLSLCAFTENPDDVAKAVAGNSSTGIPGTDAVELLLQCAISSRALASWGIQRHSSAWIADGIAQRDSSA